MANGGMPCGQWKALSHIFESRPKRQHRSGLGIEAQRAAIERFAQAESLTIIAEYTEAETGKGWTGGHSWPRHWQRRVNPSAASWCPSSIDYRATLPLWPA
jgi:hypothetical protein